MNYKKIYDNLIERSKSRLIEGYTENHHILPRCLGGTDDLSNIAVLTPEEHFLAHQLLVKLYPTDKRLIFAAQMMTTHSTSNRVNNKMFGWMRRRLSVLMSGDNNPNRKNPEIQKEAAKKRVGQKRTAETKQRMSDAQKGRTFSDETKLKMAESARTRPPISEETRVKLKQRIPSSPWKGKQMSDETKAKMSASRKGRKMSDEAKAKMKLAAIAREENKRKQKETT